MCGIAGVFDWQRRIEPASLAVQCRAMTAAIAHRGPDGEGVWHDAAQGIALGHRRLAIQDLSAAGDQPMHSASGRWSIVFNGEIYTHLTERPALIAGGARFRGSSDTETILALVDAHGVEAALERLVGMFALALWDHQEEALWLVRDRLGVKPLYWAEVGGSILFASELRGLSVHPDCPRSVDPAAMALYFRFGAVPAPHTMWAGVGKLEAGSWLRISRDGRRRQGRYWDIRTIAAEGIRQPRLQPVDRLIEEAEALIQDAVACRLISDVPLGAFLSGGIDSSVVVAMMQRVAGQRVRSFAIGFDDPAANEAAHAEAVADHLGTDHTTLMATESDAQRLVRQLPALLDEPLADPSILPTFLVSRLTRQHVTVALSGDGGDELFAGYDRHRLAQRLTTLRQRAGFAGPLLAPLVAGAAGFAGGQRDTLLKLSEVLALPGAHALYTWFVAQWKTTEAILPGVTAAPAAIDDPSLTFTGFAPAERMQLQDMLCYLPEVVLTKVDRASMAVALEAREPLLDHRLVAFAWQVPLAAKLRDGRGKWLLREVLYRHVPRTLVDRPKQGFSPPIGRWLAGPLRAWAEDLLSDQSLKAHPMLDAATARQAWQRFLSGRDQRPYAVWTLLVYLAWSKAPFGNPASLHTT